MSGPGARAAEADTMPVEQRWWKAPASTRARIRSQEVPQAVVGAYRLGGSVLQLSSTSLELLSIFDQLYGDCKVDSATRADITCEIWRDREAPLILISFAGLRTTDAGATALPHFRCSTTVEAPFDVSESSEPGWQLAGGTGHVVVAATATEILIDASVLESDFLPEYVVALVLASQTDVIVVHAAAASIGGAGALITGGSHAGKTTLAVQLAARGHQVLGDETAVLRSASNELLPLPRSVNLRPGPRDARVIAALDALGDQAGPPTDLWSSVIRMGELFPSSRPDPVELRAAFLLDGFTDRASVVPYEVNLDDEFFFMCLAGNETAYSSWGTYVERRAARLLALKRILERCPFWRVEVGPPDETAELIEHTLEGKTC